MVASREVESASGRYVPEPRAARRGWASLVIRAARRVCWAAVVPREAERASAPPVAAPEPRWALLTGPREEEPQAVQAAVIRRLRRLRLEVIRAGPESFPATTAE